MEITTTEQKASLNEQGAESKHARFISLQRTYGSMQNKVERLKCTVRNTFAKYAQTTCHKRHLPNDPKKVLKLTSYLPYLVVDHLFCSCV